jgi:hypothetical protein
MGKREVIFFKKAGDHSDWKEKGRNKLRISAFRKPVQPGWGLGKNSKLIKHT